MHALIREETNTLWEMDVDMVGIYEPLLLFRFFIVTDLHEEIEEGQRRWKNEKKMPAKKKYASISFSCSFSAKQIKIVA